MLAAKKPTSPGPSACKARANGAFTRVALDSLRKLPGDADYAAWMAEIRKSLPSREYPQKPDLVGTASQRRWRVLA